MLLLTFTPGRVRELQSNKPQGQRIVRLANRWRPLSRAIAFPVLWLNKVLAWTHHSDFEPLHTLNLELRPAMQCDGNI